MFGCSAQVGLLSMGIPEAEINNVNTEEDIERICAENNDNETTTRVIDSPITNV